MVGLPSDGRGDARQFALNALRQMPGFSGAIRGGEALDRTAAPSRAGREVAPPRHRHRVGQVALLAKNLAGRCWLNHSTRFRLRAKVLPQTIELMRATADAFVARLLVDGDIGLAEGVDGLHGIADAEGGACSSGSQVAKQTGEQFDLDAVGVLKFIDQNVADSIAQLQSEFGGIALLPDGIECALRVLGKVDDGLLGEDKMKMGGGQRQRPPRTASMNAHCDSVVTRIGQTANAMQRIAEFVRRWAVAQDSRKTPCTASSTFFVQA